MPEGPRSAPVRLTCSLLAGAAVDALAAEVGVAVVACVLLDHAQVDPIAASYDVSPTGQVVYVQFKQGQQELWMTDFH